MVPPGKLSAELLAPPKPAPDRRLRDAALAVTALIDHQGLVAGRALRGRLLRLLVASELARNWDSTRTGERFAELVGGLVADPSAGRTQAFKAIAEMASDSVAARQVLALTDRLIAASGIGEPTMVTLRQRIAVAAGLVTGTGPQGEEPEAHGVGWPRLIVLACTKGGTGKSTTAAHLAIGLLQAGHNVGTLDLDGEQGTFSRYLTNRAVTAEQRGAGLALPRHARIAPSGHVRRDAAEEDEAARFAAARAELADCSYIVVDTPGSDGHLSRLACAAADTLITPLNDSFLDLDVLARIDPGRREVLGPSAYCKRVWEENDRRVASGGAPIDWIVLRTRLAQIASRNSRELDRLLHRLAQRAGFRLCAGLSERVVFRELFPLGLTVFDRIDNESRPGPRESDLGALREIAALLAAITATSAGRSTTATSPETEQKTQQRRTA